MLEGSRRSHLFLLMSLVGSGPDGASSQIGYLENILSIYGEISFKEQFGFPYRGDSTRPADMACGGSLSAVATLCSTEDVNIPDALSARVETLARQTYSKVSLTQCGITVHRWFVYYTGVGSSCLSRDCSLSLVLLLKGFLRYIVSTCNDQDKVPFPAVQSSQQVNQ
jgi:hypothetical protein